MPSDWQLFVDGLTRGGLVGALAFALFGGYKQWYVWGHQVRALNEQWQARFTELNQSWQTRYNDERTQHQEQVSALRRELEETKQERDRYLGLALSATSVAEVYAGRKAEMN